MIKSVIIVDTLSIFSLIPILLRFRPVRRIFYLHKTRGIFDRMLIKVLGLSGWVFEQIQYTLSPENGVSPYRELGRLCIEKMKACKERILSKYTNALNGISEYECARLLAYFGRFAGSEIYFCLQILVLLKTKIPYKNDIKVVLLRRNIFSEVIADTYKENNLETFFYFGTRIFSFREHFAFDKKIYKDTVLHIRSFLNVPLYVCYSLFCKFIHHYIVAQKQIEKHKICALAANRYGMKLSNCIPWIPAEEGNLKHEILIFYPDYFSKDAIDFYAKRSDRCLEYSFNPFRGNKDIELTKSWVFYINFYLKNLCIYKNLFGFIGVKGWMFKYLIDMLTYLSFFEAAFWVNGCRVLWVMNEDDSVSQMAAMAINRQAGTSLGATWSQVSSPEWSIQHNHNDIYFTWGRRLAEVKALDQCKFFVMSGYPADMAFADEFKRAQDLRSLISKRYNAKNILAFFDNASANDLPLTPENVFEIYREAFSWLEDDPTNFFIIKAKRTDTVISYSFLKEKIEWFVKNGRIVILYDKAVIYPGLAADVVLGASSLTLSSLTAVLGRPLIFYDVHNVIRDYPLDLPNIHVISRANQIREVLNSILAQGNNRLTYSEKLQPIKGSAIDPFVDGRSAERMREYIENLLKKFEDGYSNTTAIDFANQEHKKRWGEDTVLPGPLEAIL